ncbi:COX15/CtaA family protein [Halostella pelagica]|uniref:COX15/CtaA family protein n=1 Tax=Halostella pelagica TaxID=2583824 RepID=UPI00192A3DED|nr:COX15/CtaA family protein [Halostella pelagica]
MSSTSGSNGTDRFRGLAVATAIMTFLLILIGLYTATAGFGLTCETRWPFCDGAVFGLFPANWGSFVEWFHRLVAMATGFMILGLTAAAWRGGRSRRVRYAAATATLVLPTQIVLGALTVTEYELLILAAHFATALLIFLPVTAVAAWALADGDTTRGEGTAATRAGDDRNADASDDGERRDAARLARIAALPPVILGVPVAVAAWSFSDGPAVDRAGLVAATAVPLAAFALASGPAVRRLAGGTRRSRSRIALGGSLPLLLLGVVLTPGLILTSLGATIGYYAASLAALAALFAAGLWLGDVDVAGQSHVRLVSFAAAGTLAVQLLISRVWLTGNTVAVAVGLNLVVLVATLAAFRLSSRRDGSDPPGGRSAAVE